MTNGPYMDTCSKQEEKIGDTQRQFWSFCSHMANITTLPFNWSEPAVWLRDGYKITILYQRGQRMFGNNAIYANFEILQSKNLQIGYW